MSNYIGAIIIIVFALAILWGRSKMKKIPGGKEYLMAGDIYSTIIFIPFLIFVGVVFMLPGETTWIPQYN
jgi:FtsH-binding integral membrane protein